MTEELQEKLRWWSYRRQGLDRRGSDLEGALFNVIAVYSAHPSAPLSLRARSSKFSAEEFQELDGQGRTLRIPAMRSSIHMVPHETATTIFWATKQPLSAYARRLAYAGVTENEYPKLRDRILEVARTPMTPQEIANAVVIASDQRLNTVLRYMALEGVLLRIGPEGLRSNQLTYVATRNWTPEALHEVPVEKAQRWLSKEYLRAFGPARRKDFRWWAGIKQTAAESALGKLDIVDVGQGNLLSADEADAFANTRPDWNGSVDLLPKWDCYVMGYASDGRSRFVDPKHQDRVYTSAGDGLPIILLDGRAIANWSMSFDKTTMVVKTDFFDKPHSAVRTRINDAFEALSQDLNADKLRVN